LELKKKLVLASSSPRRKLLLRQIGLEFEARESGVPEDHDELSPPDETVRRLALAKARAVAAQETSAYVIGADTVVVLDGRLLGKPKDAAEASAMLRRLSGRRHTVYTGVAFVERPSDRSRVDVVTTEVEFRNLGEEEILAYVRSGSPMDKAGAYGIQDDFGAVFVSAIEGCFYNVVGFPLSRFYVDFQEFQRASKDD
jgi:septum formation protein